MSPIEKFGTAREKSKARAMKEINESFAERQNPTEELEDNLSALKNSRENNFLNLPKGLIDAQLLHEKYPKKTERLIYDWYQKAIGRRKREPLEKERFINHFFKGGTLEPACVYGDWKKGFLLGLLKYGVFIPTHFAPKSLRSGYQLMKELEFSKKIPVIIAITEDLAKTLEKMPGWKVLDTKYLSLFRGEEIEKVIIHNSHPEVKNLMLGLLSEYLAQHSPVARPLITQMPE